jgi:EmrB/QacA subfamily drug resistance transporter
VDDHGRLHPHHRDDLAGEPLGGARRRLALAVLCLCALTAGIDLTITNVALPYIGRALDAPTNELQWIVASYSIVLAGLLVLGGALADRHGRRRVFLVSYSLFALASLGAAFSSSAGELIAFRALMGVGAAGVTAPALAIIATMYRPEERSRAIGTFVVFGAAGLTVGPIAGGLLLDRFWWGSVFLVNVPVVALGVVLGARTIPESLAPAPSGGPPRLDVVGALASVVGLGALLFGVIEAPHRGWTAPEVLAALALGLATIFWFVARELRSRSPLFDPRILQRPAVATGAMTLLLAYLLFNAFLFVNPQYLQDVRGESVVTVGLLFVPFALVFGACSLQAQRVLQRLGARATICLGLGLSGVAAASFVATLSGPLWGVIASAALFGGGLSLLIAPPSTVLMNGVPPARAGDGSSLSFVSRFVGASAGVAIVGSVIASIFASDVDPAGSLDPAQTDKVRGSLQGALDVADTLPGTSGGELAASARDAFDLGAAAAYSTLAVLAVLGAVMAWLLLGRYQPRGRS